MPSRRDYDVPAAALAAAMGVLVILVSAPFTVQAYLEVTDTGKDFTVAWSQGKAMTKDAALTSTSAPVTAQVMLMDKLPAMAMLTLKGCNDSAGSGAATGQSAASITVKLTRTVAGKSTPIGNPATFTCANKPSALPMETMKAPDLGTVKGKDEADARAAVDAKTMAGMQDVTYTVEVSATRAASTVPSLPGVNAPTLSVSVELSATAWGFTATLPAEASK